MKTKRMSDVFELPVDSLEFLDLTKYETSDKDDEAIAHAINHVDALADALEDLMEWHVKNVHVVHHPKYDNASRALKAYRGEK